MKISHSIWEEGYNCSMSFDHFSQHYLKIMHPKLGMVPFELHDYHRRLLDSYNTNRFVLVKKFRSAGYLTMSALYGLWQCIFQPQRRVFVLSPSYREAEEVSELVSRAIHNLPEWMSRMVVKNTKHEKTFALDSRMDFYTWEACRGRLVTHLIIDEVAFIKDFDKKWPCVFPTLSTDGKCFALSTTNGIGNWFEQAWSGALQGTNNFKAFEADYRENPIYKDEGANENMRKMMGEAAWLQEVEGHFLISK
jgi:hypothetical protein